MIPTHRLVALGVVPLLLAVAYVVVPGAMALVVAADVALVLLAVADALAARGEVSVVRTYPHVLGVGAPGQVEITVRNLGTQRLRVRVADDIGGQVEGLPAQADLPAGQEARMTYGLTLPARGRWDFGRVAVRWRSPLGLWERQRRLLAEGDDGEAHVRVYPDFRHLRRYGLRAREDERRAPVRARRRPGGENEFERLRPYVSGDPYRHIDWKATARKRQFITREFQQESDQNVVFLLDAGRSMTARLGTLSAFDHALNGALATAHVASRHGDRVGLMAFDDQVRVWLPPRGGRRAGAAMLQATYDLFPSMREPDLTAAFRHLASRVRRRSLVVVFTAMTDDVSAATARAVVKGLRSRHLPLVVWLRDPELDALAEGDAQDGERFERAAAAEIVAWREAALEDLRRRGALVVDVAPEEVSSALLARYLEIKAKRLL